MNWIAESISLVAHLLLIASYLQKKASRIFLFQIIAASILVVYFIVLDASAIVLIVSAVIALTRNIALFFYRRADKIPPIPLLLLFLSALSAVFFIYLDNWVDVIPFLLTLMFTYSCFYGSSLQIKITGGVITSLGHIILFLVMWAPVALVFNAAILAGTCAGFVYDATIRKRREQKKEVACMIEESRAEALTEGEVVNETND
jgi:hypothetical protein